MGVQKKRKQVVLKGVFEFCMKYLCCIIVAPIGYYLSPDSDTELELKNMAKIVCYSCATEDW